MKKQRIPILLILTVAFCTFLLGFYLGRNARGEAVTVSVPPAMQTIPAETTLLEETQTVTQPQISFPIDISSAGKEEFMALPGIGEVLAQRILDYRENTGGFTRVEELLNVEGIGEKRFEDIYDLITIGG